MGEQPIYTTKAHIFQIDAANKKQWVPLSSSAVFVQFVYDSQKNVGRIISADNGKPILNSILHSNVSFLKTSQKFGQWADPKAITVYGVGFGTESDLNRFAEKFRELRELVVNKTAGSVSNGNGDIMSMRSNSTTSALSSIGKDQQNAGSGWRLSTSVSMGAVSKPQSVPLSLSTSPSETQISGKTASNLPNSNSNSVQQVQSDHVQQQSEQSSPTDRQRIVSGQSSITNLNSISSNGGITTAVHPVAVTQQNSSSVKQMELELGSLRIENNRLMSALKDANDGVEEWKRKSGDYRDEVHRLRKKLTDLEITASKNNERESTAVDDLQRLLHTYKAKLGKLEEEHRLMTERLVTANQEREEIQRKYDDLLGAANLAKGQLAEAHHFVLDKAEELTSLANKLANVL